MENSNTKNKLLFRIVVRKCYKLFKEFTTPEPLVKEEAIENTLYLLDRDFNPTEQNEILLNLIQRLHAKRESDVIKLEKQLEELKFQTNLLKDKLLKQT